MSLVWGYLVALYALSMFLIRTEQKIIVLLVAQLCLTAFPCPIPLLGITTSAFPLLFLISELPRLRMHVAGLRQNKILTLLILPYISLAICLITSPHLHNGFDKEFFFFVRDTIFCSYLILAYAYVAFTGENALPQICKTTYKALLVLTFFSVIHFFTDNNFFVNTFLGGNVMASNELMERATRSFAESRMRVGSMFMNPFDYGFVCVLLLIFHLYCYNKGVLSRTKNWISVVCCIFGIVVCGSRTVLVTAIIAVLFFMTLALNNSNRKKYVLLITIISLVLVNFVPAFSILLDKMLSAFQFNSSMEGSSLEMRSIQLLSVLNHIQGHEILGCGHHYFLIDLGWGEGTEYLVDKDLAGLEGVFLGVLLERGIVGLLLYYATWITILIHAYKLRHIDKQTFGFICSIIMAQQFFAHATGELMSLAPTLIFLAIGLKIMHNRSTINVINNEGL